LFGKERTFLRYKKLDGATCLTKNYDPPKEAASPGKVTRKSNYK
jgi:hypothetical protein